MLSVRWKNFSRLPRNSADSSNASIGYIYRQIRETKSSYLDLKISHSSDDVFHCSFLFLGYHTVLVFLQKLNESVTDRRKPANQRMRLDRGSHRIILKQPNNSANILQLAALLRE